MSILDTPSPPEDFKHTAYSETTISLAWASPKDDGGSPVTGYYVERRESAKLDWTPEGETTDVTLTSRGLREMTSYLYRVCAINAIGRGAFAEMTEPVTAKCPHNPPGPPQNAQTSNLTKTSLTLTWEPPLDDGGAPVLGYHIERRFGDSPRWLQINRERVTSLMYDATDLVDEYSYEFRVLAVNKVNVGEPSEPTEPVVPKDPYSKYKMFRKYHSKLVSVKIFFFFIFLAVPEAPGVPECSNVTGSSVNITWSPPNNDGGAPVTSYVMQLRKDTDSDWSSATDVTIEKNEFKMRGTSGNNVLF